MNFLGRQLSCGLATKGKQNSVLDSISERLVKDYYSCHMGTCEIRWEWNSLIETYSNGVAAVLHSTVRAFDGCCMRQKRRCCAYCSHIQSPLKQSIGIFFNAVCNLIKITARKFVVCYRKTCFPSIAKLKAMLATLRSFLLSCVCPWWAQLLPDEWWRHQKEGCTRHSHNN